ncbi:MAG: hypothetical protein AAGJ35_03605, partial [Myxococcota bacterium]
MAMFVNKKNLVQQIKDQAWQTAEERTEMLTRMAETKLRSADVAPLIMSRDQDVRRLAIKTFLEKPDVAGVKALLRILENANNQIRESGGQILSRVGMEQLMPPFEAYFNDRSPGRQRKGWEMVLTLRGSVGAILLERAVLEATVSLRPSALQRLLQERSPDQVQVFLADIARSKDMRLSSTALEALTHVRNISGELMALMIECLTGHDGAKRQLASSYLQKIAKADPKNMREKMFEL